MTMKAIAPSATCSSSRREPRNCTSGIIENGALALIFDDDERGPADELRLAFEGTRHLDPDEQAALRQVLEAMLLRHDARRWTQRPEAS
jgi:hypothetical protein